MKSSDDLEERIRGFRLRTRPELDRRVLAAARAALETSAGASKANASTGNGSTRSAPVVRIRPAYAAAGALFMLACFLIYHLQAPAQTIADVFDAMEKRPWLHLVSRGPGGELQEEGWFGFEARIFAEKSGGKLRFLDFHNGVKDEYDPSTRTITRSTARESEIPLDARSPAGMLRAMIRGVEKQGASIDKKDSDRDGGKVTVYEISTSRDQKNTHIELLVDRESGLLIQAAIKVVHASGKPLTEMAWEYSYPLEGPGGVYDLGAPQDAEVIDHRQERKRSPESKFPNEPGWTWAIKPWRAHMRSSGRANGELVIALDGTEKGLRMYIAHAPSKTRYRPVGFDEDRARYDLQGGGGGGNGDVKLSSYLLEASALRHVRYVGIEKLTPEGEKIHARRHAALAREEGMATFPYPELDRPFRFAATTTDGKRVRTADFKGQWLLIDCWATWCGPCMKKMPELKRLEATWRARGLRVLGVSLDSERAMTEEAIRSKALPWPQVLAPTQPKERELWIEASGIRTLPRLFLLDPDGVLRLDGNSLTEIEVEIEKRIGDTDTESDGDADTDVGNPTPPSDADPDSDSDV